MSRAPVPPTPTGWVSRRSGSRPPRRVSWGSPHSTRTVTSTPPSCGPAPAPTSRHRRCEPSASPSVVLHAGIHVASSWATAEVSGLAALLFAEYPNLAPAQVSTRIIATARGAMNDSALDGHGMIQPLEALTADLDIAKDGRLRRAPAYAAPRSEVTAPDPPLDIAEESRETMVWWCCRRGRRHRARTAAASAHRPPAYLSDVRCGRQSAANLTAPARTAGAVRVAEDRGFEPLRALTQHAFQACAIGH